MLSEHPCGQHHAGLTRFELEHQQLGFEFGTFTDRFERLDEALQIIAPMLRGERPTFDGMDALPDDERAAATARHFVGDPDQVAADLQARVLDPGVDGLIVNLVKRGLIAASALSRTCGGA